MLPFTNKYLCWQCYLSDGQSLSGSGERTAEVSILELMDWCACLGDVVAAEKWILFRYATRLENGQPHDK